MVFSGFVTAWRLATCPAKRSPFLAKPTTEGVVRPPSWFGITTACPPSITATTELVVPKSMPMILLIFPQSSRVRSPASYISLLPLSNFSVLLSSPKRGDGADPGSPPSRHHRSQQNDGKNIAKNRQIRKEIERFQREKHAVYSSTGGQRQQNPDREPDPR